MTDAKTCELKSLRKESDKVRIGLAGLFFVRFGQRNASGDAAAHWLGGLKHSSLLPARILSALSP
jgi:hypothetical protein